MIRGWGENRWLVLDTLAVVTGFVGGLGAVVFRWLAGGVQGLFFGPVAAAVSGGDGGVVLLPVLGGLAVGLLILRLAPEARGEGSRP